MLGRLRHGLQKTRDLLFTDLEDLVRGSPRIDAELLEEIETRLLQADLGVDCTTDIIATLEGAIRRNQVNDYQQLLGVLRQQMQKILLPVQHPLVFPEARPDPFVILVVGVNGAGKTTTIGKLAHHCLGLGRSVMLAAGDTFRAAAIEQIQSWGERAGVPVVAQQSGADAAAVIYDALQSARARAINTVIADTAGRLHNKDNLMEELAKIRRTITKVEPGIPVEVMLVLDAGTGQNSLVQAKQFNDIIGVDGITLTKLDGTARGGILFALARSLSIPIRFIGVGEQLDDLRPFSAEAFIDALLDGP